MKEFKIRCSAIGKIMTNARSKTETLSKTTKTYLEEWSKEQIYNRKKEVFSKYIDKGNAVEVESLNFIAKELNYNSLVKNDESFENGFLTGTPAFIIAKEPPQTVAIEDEPLDSVISDTIRNV